MPTQHQQPGAGQVRIEVRTGSWNEKTKKQSQAKQAHLACLTYYLFTSEAYSSPPSEVTIKLQYVTTNTTTLLQLLLSSVGC